MLQFIFVLHILCFVPGNAFPQRNKPDPESNFDFDAYLEHFTPLQQTVKDYPSFLPNQDYRYIPLLGERPDYIPPILHRGHFPHPNIPRRVVKHRAWHSNYQNANFPTYTTEHPTKNIQHQDAMQSHKRKLDQLTDFSLSNSNFNFQLNPKMEDFGDYEAPVVIEAIEKKEVPLFRQQNDDYDLPVVVSAIVKKQTPDSIKRNQHKRPISVPIKKVQVVKDHAQKPAIAEPSPDLDYEAPVVVGVFVKKNQISASSNNKQTIVVKTPEIYKSSFSEDYEEPIVLEALTKVDSSLNRKPVKARPVVNKHGHTNQMVKPIVKPVSPDPVSSYLDYEAPVVIEAFTKKSVHTKEHNKFNDKPFNKHDVTNPVHKPVETASTYLEDYESPIVLETFTKKDSHIKEHGPKHPVEAKPVINKQVEKVINNPPENILVSSYNEDFEAPIVVEALTKEELFHKGHSNKKSSVIKSEKPEANKEDSKQVVRPKEEYTTEDYGTEDYVTEEYGSEESITEDYDESEHSIDWNEDYDSPVESQMIHDSKDYEYESPIVMEDKAPKRKHQISKEHKSVVQPPMKIRTETTNENYEKLTSDPTESKGSYETSKVSEGPVVKENKKRVKREIKVDYEDYELPVVVSAIVKKTTVSKEHGKKSSGEIKSSEYEQDYETPVIVEAIVKRDPVVTPKHTLTKPANVEHPIDYYDYEAPVVLEAIVKKRPGVATSHKPATVKPDYAYDYELPVIVETFTRIETPEHKRETVELPSKEKPQINREDYKMEQKPVAYSRNKRDRQYHNRELPKIVNPIARQDLYERPIDKAEMQRYNFNFPQRPGDYFNEGESVPKRNPVHENFDSKGMSDNQIILDSITINRENPDGREIPFLEVLAVDDQAESRHETGVKVVAFNKENGDVDIINLGHVDSNHEIEELDDHGSGSVIDERSVAPRSFIPLDGNAWSFMNHVQAQERRKFKRCVTPRNETGNCMPVQMCPVPNIGVTVDDLLKNVCIIDEVFIGICCPEFPVETVRVDWDQFGRPDTEPLIDNDEASQEAKECGKIPSTIGDKDSWPWMAPLVSTTSDKVFCGGALINEYYVLTAAHCTSRIPRNQILVRLGNLDSRHSSNEFAVVEIKRHAQYNPRTMQNDIALLKLSRRVPLGNFRKLVCLPDSDVEDYVGETAVLLRWQRIAEKGAVESLPVVSNHDCQNRLGTLVGGSVLCTETRNDEALCNADSGAPLVISKGGKFKIIGVLTWNRNDCDGRYPSVFTRVSSYQKWIRTHAA